MDSPHGGRDGHRLHATAAVLAGGRSSRFGQDKAMVLVHGRPLIERIVESLSDLFDQVIISCDNPGRFAYLGLPIVVDPLPGRGPLMGIVTALHAAVHDRVFVVACDTPIVEASVVRSLVSLASEGDCAVPILDGRHPEPLFAVYRKSLLPVAQEILDDGKGAPHELYTRVSVKILRVANADWYTNLNTRSELERFLSTPKGRQLQSDTKV